MGYKFELKVDIIDKTEESLKTLSIGVSSKIKVKDNFCGKHERKVLKIYRFVIKFAQEFIKQNQHLTNGETETKAEEFVNYQWVKKIKRQWTESQTLATMIHVKKKKHLLHERTKFNTEDECINFILIFFPSPCTKFRL
eukprot:251673_1